MDHRRPTMIRSNQERGSTSHHLVIDISIIGGIIIADVIYDRVIRPYFNEFVIGLHRLHRHVVPCLLRFGNSIISARPNMLGSLQTVKHFTSGQRSNLVRWLAAKLPASVFTRSQRIYIWMNKGYIQDTIEEETVVFGPAATAALDHRLARASFRYIPELGDLDDCNEDGLIHAYEKTGINSDEESDDLWSQVDPDGDTNGFDFVETADTQSECGTINVTSFDPRRNARSSTPVKLTFGKEYSEESTSQIQQSEAKVAALEAQLNEMKAMIALILENQNRTMTTASQENNQTIIPLTITNVTDSIAKPVNGPPPPPPPPPPPMPMTPLSAGNAQIKLKVGRKSGSLGNAGKENPAKPKPEAKCMGDVLKGLSNVKLKPTQRSPGGTPLKRPKIFSPNDASSMIALALKKRFARIHSPPDSEHEDGSDSNKENKDDDCGDSFDSSPLIPKTLTGSRVFQKRSSLFHSKATDSVKPPVIHEVSESLSHVDDVDPLPMFGQHLLKSSSSTVLKQEVSPLGLQNQNVY